MSRSLGMRRKALKCCLHDPFAEGALVLYAPPEVSAHDQISQKEQVFLILFYTYFVLPQ